MELQIACYPSRMYHSVVDFKVCFLKKLIRQIVDVVNPLLEA